PVAGPNERVLVQQVRIVGHDAAHCVDIVAPNGIDDLATLDQSRPTRRAIFPREGELRIRELGVRRIYLFGVMCAESGNRVRIAIVNGAEEILGLVLQLIQVRAERQLTGWHDEPPWKARGPLTS